MSSEAATNGYSNELVNLNENKRALNETQNTTETPNKKFKSDQQRLEPEYFRKVFVGSLNYNTSEESLRNHFEQFGELVDCVIMKESKTGKSRGFGFVTYSKSTMVDEMMKNRPHKLDGRELETKRATPREESGKPGAEMTTKKLFVGAIREGISEENLREYFSKYGNIEDCVVMKEKETNKTRGFGFVTFDDYDPVDKIVLEKNHIINGQSLAVKKALPKEQTTPTGGSGHMVNAGPTGANFTRGNKFNNPNQMNNNMNRGGGRFNNNNPNYNENFNYNNYNNNPNPKNFISNNNPKNTRYNEYSDDFNTNNFHDSGFNSFTSNQQPGMPIPSNNVNNNPAMPPQMPQGMPNNFTNFALLAQKMLQAGFGAGGYPPAGMNQNFVNQNQPGPNMMDRNQANNVQRRGFEQNNRGGGAGNFGAMRDGGNNNRRQAPYSQNIRKPK